LAQAIPILSEDAEDEDEDGDEDGDGDGAAEDGAAGAAGVDLGVVIEEDVGRGLQRPVPVDRFWGWAN